MNLPRMLGEIERRLLVNYRVDPVAIADLIPARLRLQLVDGAAVAGICLIRLGHLRPTWAPESMGLTTENAAHRVAVEWDDGDVVRSGVYIPRRDTDSRLTELLGGRLFSGTHHRARFDVDESEHRVHVSFVSVDGAVAVDVDVDVESELDGSQLFADLDEASRFFEAGSIGFSPGRAARFDAVQLSTHAWRVEAGRVLNASSTFFDDSSRFPAGQAVLDSALVMRKVPVTWDALSTHDLTAVRA